METITRQTRYVIILHCITYQSYSESCKTFHTSGASINPTFVNRLMEYNGLKSKKSARKRIILASLIPTVFSNRLRRLIPVALLLKNGVEDFTFDQNYQIYTTPFPTLRPSVPAPQQRAVARPVVEGVVFLK